MAGLRELLIAAFLLTMSLMLTIFACTLIADHNAWPLLPFVFYFFAPVPAFLCTRRSDSIMDSGSGSSFDNFGHFLIGLCAASGPSMSLVQYHTGAITLSAMFMSLGSAALLAAAVGVVLFSSAKQDQFLS